MSWVPYRVVDAFTDRPFAGNPAAVVALEAPADERWMRAVAREMNLSETAFLVPRGDRWHIRWLAPAVEVDLCGHATLASAHALWESGAATGAVLRFDSRSGPLAATREGDRIALDFPARPATACAAPPGLAEALGATLRWVGLSADDYLVEVGDDATVRSLAPDLAALRSLGARGVTVTARDASGRYDIVSRFFAPGAGIDEDPVTGSAHCTLGPYWSPRLGRATLRAFQASPRGGELEVRVGPERVQLVGRAVTVTRGELLAEGA